MMEFYFGQEAGELVVPKTQDYFDRLPSPDSWSQWGTCESGWPNDFDAGKISSLPVEKSQQQSLFGSTGTKEKNQLVDEVEHSYDSTSFRGSSEDSRLRNSAASGGRPDFFFNNLVGSDAMDDIFMNSLLEDDVSVSAQKHGQFSLSPQYQNSMISSESDSANKALGCRSVPRDAEGARSMNCFGTPPCSPEDDSDDRHASFSDPFYGDYTDQNNEPSPSLQTREMQWSDQDVSRRSGEEESSIEESVLMGLENVLSQLSNNTRLCLRDSLYRLAQHSKEQTIPGKPKVEDLPLDKFSLLDHVDGDSRSEKTEAAMRKGNTIDRAVANLMFNKVDTNVQDLLPAMAAKFEHIGKNFETLGHCNYSFSKAQAFPGIKPSDSLDHSEVPVYSQENFSAMQN
ncbi:hypothetical protein RND81_10G095000 [Saponaria officinalis]